MAYVSNISGYDVKDKEAREQITQLQNASGSTAHIINYTYTPGSISSFRYVTSIKTWRDSVEPIEAGTFWDGMSRCDDAYVNEYSISIMSEKILIPESIEILDVSITGDARIYTRNWHETAVAKIWSSTTENGKTINKATPNTTINAYVNEIENREGKLYDNAGNLMFNYKQAIYLKIVVQSTLIDMKNLVFNIKLKGETECDLQTYEYPI